MFIKQLLIIKVWLLLQNRALNYSTKKQLDFICPGLDFVSWTVHESSVISHQKEFEMQLLIIKVIMSSNDCFFRTGLWNTQQKAVRLYFVFVEILHHERLFIVNKGNWWLESRSGGANVKNVRLTEDCRRGFKLKAVNHKINSCQAYIRHFGRFSILAKAFKTRISIFAFFSSWSSWELLNWVSHHFAILLAVLLPLAYA